MAHAGKKKSSSIKNPKTYEGLKKKGMPKSRAAAAATPQALAGLFPTNHRVDARTERAIIDFYLQRVGDYVGRPMLSPLLGVYAAWNGTPPAPLGGSRRAIPTSSKSHIWKPTSSAANGFPDKARTGPFMANLGGFLMSCLYGLTGLELSGAEPSEWFTRTVVLPEGWNAIVVDRLCVRGKPMQLIARHGEPKAMLSPR